jgi:hypothetical protein
VVMVYCWASAPDAIRAASQTPMAEMRSAMPERNPLKLEKLRGKGRPSAR